MLWPKYQPFLFLSLSAVCPRLDAPLLSVNFLVFCYRLLPSRRCPATMLPASFDSNPESSPALGLECICRNITAIGTNPPLPALGSSVRRTSILVHGMGEGLSLKFSSQESGKWYVRLSSLLIVANARELRFVLGGHHCHGTPRDPWR